MVFTDPLWFWFSKLIWCEMCTIDLCIGRNGRDVGLLCLLRSHWPGKQWKIKAVQFQRRCVEKDITELMIFLHLSLKIFSLKYVTCTWHSFWSCYGGQTGPNNENPRKTFSSSKCIIALSASSSWNHICVYLDICFGSLPCCKVKTWPSFK